MQCPLFYEARSSGCVIHEQGVSFLLQLQAIQEEFLKGHALELQLVFCSALGPVDNKLSVISVLGSSWDSAGGECKDKIKGTS
jgi:hypothetical protein